MSPEEQARDELADYLDRNQPGCGYTSKMLDVLLAFVRAAEAKRQERIISLIEGGSFLHDEAPAARFAREVVAAIRREIQ